MEIEEFKERLRECLVDADYLLSCEIEALFEFFKEYAKTYARSLVPNEMNCECSPREEACSCGAGIWNACREEMLRRMGRRTMDKVSIVLAKVREKTVLCDTCYQEWATTILTRIKPTSRKDVYQADWKFLCEQCKNQEVENERD